MAGSDRMAGDPFVSPSSGFGHHRYSNFDADLFALGPGASAEQARRALEAHLAETDRRMEEAGKLGTALLQQRIQLSDRLKEVRELQAEAELTPELKERLVEIEKEYNEVARESARAFLPKQRVPSNEAAGSPFAPEGKGGRRSVSPSKFESQATGSPTKLSVPNRKLRNQPSNRVHDIEFAAEISTSLISQVRNLQALLAEREEELRDIKLDKSRLEIEAEGIQQRLKSLDESEHRYKDENWNLETRIHELLAAQRDAADREKKLAQQLSVLQSEKNTAQRELDEIRVNHAKLLDEHAAAVKHHDIELGTAKRNIVMADGEKAAMQRKIDDLASQNQELAKAVSSMQRGRTLDREAVHSMSDEDFDTAADNMTPEHSPPPSPVKGTPRHSMLESETLKTSLQHAQRSIQSLRTNVHREKTEKLELKRMLQEARDELERVRAEPVASSHRRSRKTESREFKKPLRSSQLGSLRPVRTELYFEDPEWEDQMEQGSPYMSPAVLRSVESRDSGDLRPLAESSDQFETANEEANETSDAAFETAQERGTETEDFHTGAEEFSDDEDAATETESPYKGPAKRPPPAPLSTPGSRHSFHSTASTSNDEEDWGYGSELRTPTALPAQRMRLRVSRGALSRRSRQASEEPTFQSSPASFAHSSVAGTPQQPQQSLFAELGEFEGSDDESLAPTPSRRSIRSLTPASVRRGRTASPPPEVPPLPKVIMVDSGMMTEPVEFQPYPASPVSAVPRNRPVSIASVIGPSRHDASTQWLRGIDAASGDGETSRPVSTFSYSDAGAQHDSDLQDKLAQFPSPPSSSLPRLGLVPTPILAPPQPLSISAIQAEHVSPRSEPQAEPEPEPEPEPVSPPALSLSSIASEHVEPVAEPEVPPPLLHISYITSEQVEPVAEPEVLPPVLHMSHITSEQVQPVAEPEIPPPPPPALHLSYIASEHVEPVAGPEVPPPVLHLSSIASEAVEPVAEPEVQPLPPPVLNLSQIASEHVEPVAEPTVPPAPPASLRLSYIASEHVEPAAQPELPPLELSFATIHVEHVVPQAEPEVLPPAPPALSFSVVRGENVEPKPELEEPAPSPIHLSFSSIKVENVEPLAEPDLPAPPPVHLSISSIQGEHVEPVAEPAPPAVLPPPLSLSAIERQDIAPVPEPIAPPAPLSLSTVFSETIEPVEPLPEPEPPVPSLGYATIQSVGTEPVEPRSPKRNAFIIPRDVEDDEPVAPRTPARTGVFGSLLEGWSKTKTPSTPIIAEDETRQSPSDMPHLPETPESQRPLKELSVNSDARPPRKQGLQTIDQSAQTTLTADAIDEMLTARSRPVPFLGHQRMDSLGSSMGTPATVRHYREQSQESISSAVRKGKMVDTGLLDAGEAAGLRRPGSAASARASLRDVPPLPANHKEVIEAARSGSAGGGLGTIGEIGSMGPPLFPASALRNPALRPRTPNSPKPMSAGSGLGTPTPRASNRPGSPLGPAGAQSPARLTARSRQSSVSSFASEVDARFNMQNANAAVDVSGLGSNTDPRMIQAITQTMIGEYLWKYTRKAGRGEMSGNRHRRYFWVHPYTRTLYWSDRDPSSAGRAELKAKSVPIEAVRVVTDDNPMPPGLHRKSLIIVSPGRSVKFTCTTGQRHEIWFNALSYLLLRTTDEGQNDTEEMAGHITREDVEEFNPQIGQRPAAGARGRPAPSLSSYNSRTTRNESPALGMSMEIPTLTPTHKRSGVGMSANRPSVGTLGRLSGYLRSTPFGSLRSRSTILNQERDMYEASEVHDSAEDLRVMYERQDRESDRLENVRACCDGKHDVGMLSHSSRRGRHAHNHSHSQPGPSSTTATPVGTVRSKA